MKKDVCIGTKYMLDGLEALSYNEAIHHLTGLGFTYNEAKAYLQEMKSEAAPAAPAGGAK